MEDAVSRRRDVFDASLRRCLESKDFLKRFYDLFLSSSPEVKEKFRDTDFERQRRVLRDSFFVMEMVSESSPDSPAWANLRKLAIAHDRKHRDVRPELYDLWLECLIKAVSEFDPDYSPAIEKAWRKTMQTGIYHMQAAYEAR